MAVYPKVAETMADALGCDVEDIKPDVSLIEGLDAESIDFLDMVFRLERAFKIKIPRGKIVENARGDAAGGGVRAERHRHRGGPGAVARVPVGGARRAVQDADEGRGHSAAVHADDVLQARRRARSSASAGCRLSVIEPCWRRLTRAAMVRSFRRVSRSSTGSSSSSAASARADVRDSRAAIDAFPPCLVAEAVGQLAAWVAMAHIDFRGRPVAALATETRFRAPSSPATRSTLDVDILECDDDAVAYNGRASVDGDEVIELVDCLGPMLPVAEFDAPEALRERFELLRGGGAPPGAFHGVAPMRVDVTQRDARRVDRAATLRRSRDAPFFADHFPRRPVFPATLLLDAQIELALDARARSAGAGATRRRSRRA